jgi:hypothetical protein
VRKPASLSEMKARGGDIVTGYGPTGLVVDDEEMIASMLAIILRQSGFVATSFNNPVEALQISRGMP